MPIWTPPTPPQDDNDLYIDYSLGFLYEQNVMPDSQLPPVYIPKESNKRLKLDTTIARKQKVRKEEGFNIPRSLFDRPSTAIIKLRRELILQKLKGTLVCGPENAAIHRTLNTLGASYLLSQTNAMPSTIHKSAHLLSGALQDSIPQWAVHEDWAILQVLQYFQDLPLNLLTVSPGHLPNWDMVSDVVNLISCNYRSPKLCRYHYELSVVPREEGKAVNESTPKSKQKKLKGLPTPSVPSSGAGLASNPSSATSSLPSKQSGVLAARPVKTSQLIAQDNNMSFSQLCNQRFETIKQIANKRTPTLKHMFYNSNQKNPKHIALLSENGINYEQPLTPIQVAVNRAQRISREKQKAVAEQQMAAQTARQLQQQLQQKQQNPQIKTIIAPNSNIPTAQNQFSQVISAKMTAINQSTLKTGISAPTAGALTTTQLTKAISQVNVASQQLSQPILSQISVSPQAMGSTTVTNTEGIPQGLQQSCSVVSVAALTPHVHQKLIAAVSPAVTQMGSRLTTASPQVYKQVILRHPQQQIQRQQSPQFQMQTISSSKQMTNLGVGQQQPRYQLTATVPSIQTAQSLISTTGLKSTQSGVVTTLPVALPMTTTHQRFTTSMASTGKPTQQIITRTITDPQLAQLIKRQQLVSQQNSGNLGQTQILVQQSSPQTQSSQSQTQLLQNPTFVKALSTQSLIPITMTGMNIFTSPVTKVMASSAANSPITTAITTVPTTQLRQFQLLHQKTPQRPQQTTQIIQQQIQGQLNQSLGQQNQQKVTTTTIPSSQPKTVAQIQSSPMGTFQILHQSPAPGSTSQGQTTKIANIAQLFAKQGIVMPHNIPTIHVSSQSATNTTGAAASLPQSILQVSQNKSLTTDSSHQSAPIAVAQIGTNQPTVKHIQVVSSSSPQTQTSGTPKNIIFSTQPTILQTTSLQSQPQTIFAIRAAQSTSSPQPQTITTQAISQTSTTSTTDNTFINTSGVVKEGETKEQMDSNSSIQCRQSPSQSPYATRFRNTKS